MFYFGSRIFKELVRSHFEFGGFSNAVNELMVNQLPAATADLHASIQKVLRPTQVD